jgi:hypothetical protein
LSLSIGGLLFTARSDGGAKVRFHVHIPVAARPALAVTFSDGSAHPGVAEFGNVLQGQLRRFLDRQQLGVGGGLLIESTLQSCKVIARKLPVNDRVHATFVKLNAAP